MKKMMPPIEDGDDAESPVELVGLDRLDPTADSSEVALLKTTDPELDSPGDDAVLEQEELMEGSSSESLPSQKVERREERD